MTRRTVSPSVTRARAVTRAIGAWTSGHPHQALEILSAAGMERIELDAFIRAAHRTARQRAIRHGVAR
jgi:hypothetical protein